MEPTLHIHSSVSAPTEPLCMSNDPSNVKCNDRCHPWKRTLLNYRVLQGQKEDY